METTSSFDIIENQCGKPTKAAGRSESFAWAAEYIAAHPPIVKHKGTLYTYQGDHYTELHDLPDKVRRFLIQKETKHDNNRVSNVVADIHAVALRESERYTAMPFYCGKGHFPPSSDIIAFRNGLLDVRQYLATGSAELITHTPHWVSTFCLPYDFDPAATCPQWEAALADVFDGDDRTKALQEWFGYTLLPDTSLHSLLIKVGPPRSMKGTIDRVHGAVLGEHNTTGFNLHSLADKFGPARLIGKHVAFVGEVQLGGSRDKSRILEAINSIVGGDPIAIERKYAAVSESVVLPTRFSISCNALPNFPDASGALPARLLVIPFYKSFVGREDRTLGDRLLTELSGIANWAIKGLRRLKQQGRFTRTAAGEKVLAEFRRESAEVLGFIQDCLRVDRLISPGELPGVELVDGPLSVTGKHLSAKYAEWCEQEGKPNRGAWLQRDLKTILPQLVEGRRMEAGSRQRVYEGIALKPVLPTTVQ